MASPRGHGAFATYGEEEGALVVLGHAVDAVGDRHCDCEGGGVIKG